MIVLGVDPSYTRTGLVWLDDGELNAFQSIKFAPSHRRLYRALGYMHGILKVTPADLVVIESMWMRKLVELAAVVKVAAQAHNIPVVEASPTKVKKWLAGKGTATKEQVARAIKRRYGISFRDDDGYDLSDAAGLSLWGMYHAPK